jgi:hypothetical protein
MPIERATLAQIASAYTSAMTPIRGRRVHRLLMREFSRFAHVIPATTQDGSAALLALGEDGSAAVCRTDGRGAAAAIAEWPRLDGATLTVSYDLHKDSLPVVSWTLSHPGIASAAGTLTVAGDTLSSSDHQRIFVALRNARTRLPQVSEQG